MNSTPPPFRESAAFTLIELLIVVAIIAILAAIAVPNFLEAQTRARVARVQADLRSMSVALESYRVDSNEYPPGLIPFIPPNPPTETWRLTTPIAYMTSIPIDTFVEPPGSDEAFAGGTFGLNSIYLHYLNDPNLGETWLLFSYGPDKDFEQTTVHYDPTNGTISNGDIFRTGVIQ